MAIAGIVFFTAGDEAAKGALETALNARPGILQIRRLPDCAETGGLAVVLEQASENLQAELKALSELSGVVSVHLAFADYEDDMDGQGHMHCPPHEERRSGASLKVRAPVAGREEA